MRCPGLLLALLLLPLASCNFDGSNMVAGGNDSGRVDGDGGRVDGDGGGDSASPDATPGCQSFSSLVDTCALTTSSGNLDLNMSGKYKYDTAMGILLDPSDTPVPHESQIVVATEGEFRAMIADQFQLGVDSTLEAKGNLPFAILSYGDILIAGEIDVGTGGAGARDDCGASTGQKGGDKNGGAGGGGGAGFRGLGGDGGQGDADGATPSASGPGGAISPIPTSPLGGCRGGAGGDGEDSGGKGGRGGGAVYLASATAIGISGGVQAGGDGGNGGQESGSGNADAGGGGGGSGGYIFLEAPAVTLTGILAANGGGGGEGSGNGVEGKDGDPGELGAGAAAGGSSSQSTGTAGGAGSAGASLDGKSVDIIENGGAGGGGGGGGFIIVLPAQSLGGTVSPPVHNGAL